MLISHTFCIIFILSCVTQGSGMYSFSSYHEHDILFTQNLLLTLRILFGYCFVWNLWPWKPRARSGAYYFRSVCLPFCSYLCQSVNINLVYNFWSIPDKVFIFAMLTPCVKHTQMTSALTAFWPRPLTQMALPWAWCFTISSCVFILELDILLLHCMDKL